MHKRNGFRSQFYGAFFVFNIPTTIACLSEASKRSPVRIKSIEEVNMEALFMYDATVFGFERHAFLSKWLRVTDSHARAAIDSEGSIVGYTVDQRVSKEVTRLARCLQIPRQLQRCC